MKNQRMPLVTPIIHIVSEYLEWLSETLGQIPESITWSKVGHSYELRSPGDSSLVRQEVLGGHDPKQYPSERL